MVNQQPIQIPSFTSPQATFQPPTDLINGYLNRQQNAQQYMGKSAIDLGQTANELRQQTLRNYLATINAKAGAFESGGPYLMNLLYGNGQGGDSSAGSPTPPQNNPTTSAPSMMPQTPPTDQGQPSQNGLALPPPSTPSMAPQGQVGGATPSNGAATPATSAQTLQGQPAQPQQAQTQQPGQPLLNPQTGLPQTIHDSLGQGMPDFSGHLAKIQQLQGQMSGMQGMGKYGQTQQQGLATQIGAEKSAMDAQQLPLQYQKTQNEIAMQPTQAALQQQQLLNAQQQIPMEKNKAIEGEAAKLSPQIQEANLLEGQYNDLVNSLTSAKQANVNLGSGNLFNATMGRVGNKDAGLAISQSKNIIPAINKLLTGRFNMGENEVLSANMAPSPNATSDYNNQRMGIIKQVIDSIKTGNAQNVRNVVSTINGGKFDFGAPTSMPNIGGAQPQGSPAINSQAQYNALPNGASYTWNGVPHVKGRS